MLPGERHVDASRPRLLVVEDDAMLRRALVRALTRAGFDIVEAANGAEAERFAGTCSFEVALIDWHLPDATGGEVLSHLRQVLGTRVYAVVCSGSRAHEVEARALALGADLFVAKPIDIRELCELLRAACST